MNALRSIWVEMKFYNDENKMIFMAQEQQEKVNIIISWSLSYLKRKRQHDLGSSHLRRDKDRKIPSRLGKHELRTNGAEGSMSRKRHKEISEDTMRGGTHLVHMVEQ